MRLDRSYLEGDFQFRMTVIGEGFSSVMVSIKNRCPSGDAAYGFERSCTAPTRAKNNGMGAPPSTVLLPEGKRSGTERETAFGPYPTAEPRCPNPIRDPGYEITRSVRRMTNLSLVS